MYNKQHEHIDNTVWRLISYVRSFGIEMRMLTSGTLVQFTVRN